MTQATGERHALDVKGPGVKIAYRVWANIANPDLSVDDAVAKLRALGNTIHQVDYDGRRVLIARKQERGALWGCRFCHSFSESFDVIEAHERECEYR